MILKMGSNNQKQQNIGCSTLKSASSTPKKTCYSVLFELEAKKEKPRNPHGYWTFWRRGRDSNPRGIAPKLISSQPRYDHFDTSPCMSNTSLQHENPKIKAISNVRTTR